LRLRSLDKLNWWLLENNLWDWLLDDLNWRLRNSHGQGLHGKMNVRNLGNALVQVHHFLGVSEIVDSNIVSLDLRFQSLIFILESVKGIGNIHVLGINLLKVIFESMIGAGKIQNLVLSSRSSYGNIVQFNTGGVELVVKVSNICITSIDLTKKSSIRLF